MQFISLSERLPSLPLVLAGPILRRVTEDSVTVWVALQETKTVRLEVMDGNATVLSGKRDTIELGTNLHIVAVTARSNNGNKLSPGGHYTYELKDDAGNPLLSDQDLKYDGFSGPGFVFAPEKLEELRIAHSSCRKPHGEGRDMLAHLDTLIANPPQRPHMLFLTGDQVYADDVADVLLFMIQDAVNALGFSDEMLPGDVSESQLLPGRRSAIVRGKANLTVDADVSYSHLLTFGEFCALYLFAWSPLLWPDGFKNLQVDGFWGQAPLLGVDFAKRFNSQKPHLNAFVGDLPLVRKALANIPTYMIFDDHDVTDDLFLHRQWCTDVLTSPLGRRVIENGLTAYALFQAWGNTPEQFKDGEAGAKLLGNLPQMQDREELDLLLGLPSNIEINAWNKDNLERLGPKSDAQLPPGQPPPKVLKFHFALTGSNYQVLFLNTRTQRGFPAKDNKAPAELIGEEGFKQQIPESTVGAHPKALTLVVSPAPVFGVEWIDNVQWWQRRLSGRRKADFERWNLSDACFGRFLSRTSDLGAMGDGQQKKATRAVILSGDVHYGYGAQVQYSDGNADTAIAQFTASSLKNQDFKTLMAQKDGYDFDITFRDREIPALGPEKTADGCYQIKYCEGIQQPAPARFPMLAELVSLLGPFNAPIPDGTQIVGFNNLGVIAILVNGDELSAAQTLHWSAPDGTQVTTTYTIPLLPKTVTCE